MWMANKGKNILIIGQHPDPHIDKVMNCIIELGNNPILFQRLSRTDQLSLIFGNDTLKNEINGISTSKIDSVWWRFKQHLPSEYSKGLGSITDDFIHREWISVLKALPYILPDKVKWLNKLENHIRANYKVYQLNLAQKLGIRIPNTIISNSPKQIKDFAELYDRVIYKTLSSFILPPGYAVFTTIVSLEDIKNSGDKIVITPGIYQEYCEKKFELRVVVIGEEIYVAKINSQKHDETKIDWRKNQFLSIYEPYRLSKESEKKLLQFHNKSGLTYGAYDYIVNSKNEEIFLECNPGGQWLWIEDKLEFPISFALAKNLSTC